MLATLIYLAIQTRGLNKQSKAETRYTFVDAMGEINMAIAQNEQSASVWRRGLDGAEQIDEDERMQFLMFLGKYCNLWSIMHQLRDEDLLPERQWLIVRNDLVSSLAVIASLIYLAHEIGHNTAQRKREDTVSIQHGDADTWAEFCVNLTPFR